MQPGLLRGRGAPVPSIGPTSAQDAALPLSLVSVALAAASSVLPAGAAGRAGLLVAAAAAAAVLVLVTIMQRVLVRIRPHPVAAYRMVRSELGVTPALVTAGALLATITFTVALLVAMAAVELGDLGLDPPGGAVVVAVALLLGLTLARLRRPPTVGWWSVLVPLAACAALLLVIVFGAARCLLATCLSIAPTAGTGAGGGAPGIAAVLQAAALSVVPVAGLAVLPRTSRSAGRLRQSLNAHTVAVVVAVALLLGVAALLAAAPVGGRPEHTSVLAAVAAATIGPGLGPVLVQVPLVAVLLQAGLVALGALPRIVSVLARDRFLPRQFVSRGDVLVFSSPTVLLAGGSLGAVLATGVDVPTLAALALCSAGVALAAALLSLARHMGRQRREGTTQALGAVGAASALLVVVVLTVAVQPVGGAVIVAVLGSFVLLARAIRGHYRETGRRLRAVGIGSGADREAPPVVYVVSGAVGEPLARGISWARATGSGTVVALLRGAGGDAAERLFDLAPDVEAVLVPAARGAVGRAGLLDAVRTRAEDGADVCVLMTDTRPPPGVERLGTDRRRQLRARSRLLRTTGAVVADLTAPIAGPGPYTVEEPSRHHVVVLVSAVDAPARRCLAFARRLHATNVQALSIELEPERTRSLLAAWEREDLDVPLDVVHSPTRSIAASVRREVRAFEPDGRRVVVTCVLPELVLPQRLAEPLHNQTAALVRDALRGERGVVTVTVPITVPAALPARTRPADRVS